MHLSEELRQRIEAVVHGAGRLGYRMDEEAASHGCIALYGTIGQIVGLKPDGTFWTFDAHFDIAICPLPEEHQIGALVLGTKRYDWLYGFRTPE